MEITCSFASSWSRDWQQCALHFLQSAYERSRSADTYHAYKRTLTLFFAGRTPEECTNADVAAFLCTRFRGAGPVSSATRNNRLGVLNKFYDFATKYQIVDGNNKKRLLFTGIKPTLGIVASKPTHANRALSEAELERFFRAIPTTTLIGIRDRAIFTLFFFTARRRREIARLRWGDLERGMVTDDQGNSHPGWLYHFRGKGRSQIDDCQELPEPARLALWRYLEASGRLGQMRATDPLFLPAGKMGAHMRADADAPLSSNTMYFQLKAYAKRAGLDPARICLHSFRHTSAKLRFLRGEKARSIQRLLRHASLQTTEVYLGSMSASADTGARLLQQPYMRFSVP